MNFSIGILLATLFLIATIAIFATKAFFPYHRIVALSVYAVGWIPFLYSISLRKQWILKHQESVTTFFQAYWLHLGLAVIMLGTIYVLLTLFPPVKSPFLGLSDQEIGQRLEEDEKIITYLNGQLESNFDEASSQNIFATDFKNISGKQKQELQNFWISYIEVMLQLDFLKERYKSFYQLNAIAKKDLHRLAFENGYAAFLSQHYYGLALAKIVKDENQRTFFNQSFPDYGIEQGMFDLIRERLTDNADLLRMNTGRAYYSLIKEKEGRLNGLIEGHLEGIDESLRDYAHLLAKKPLNFLERNAFKLWFPIQKEVAVQISFVRTATRDYLIGAEQIDNYRSRLLPGDILLERREWHATNVGIPGFWTHAALYIGSLEEMDSYFKDLPELKGASFKEYLEGNHPDALRQLLQKDEKGYSYAVVEAKRPGVILTSLEYTANADSFAVLRTRNANRQDHLKIVTQALAYLGRPYDFDFNFVTDNALVCSELVYKAYQDISALSIEMQQVNGRPIISPNQFAEKFTKESGTQQEELELILFLDGNEKDRKASEKGVDAFKDSWQRPKWHIAKDFANFQ
ncbi:MAG: YiiX/YebB-like N1pC/P60 family cysteine hydrolase [Candidatus Peregrinibacteria bacterium]|nr:YiiX/YebB-like N1pC/P60 family cysteine hydrolase [Candidatus Peregrinibacteria bacterium]